MTQNQIDMLLLIARMNMWVAEANHDTARLGAWRMDYNRPFYELEREYEKLKEQNNE